MEENNEILKISNKELKRQFVRARLEKICNCKNNTILVNTYNRTLECSECDAILDPFEVVEKLLRREEQYWENFKWIRQEKEQLEKWMLNNRMGSALREIASRIRQGLVPKCPHCSEPFDLKNLKSWCSKGYAIKNYNKKQFDFED